MGVAATPQHRLACIALDTALAFCTFGIGWLIWSMILWGQGQSPAKNILKTRVYSSNTGRPATWGHMAVREVLIWFAIYLAAGFISIFTFGFGFILYCAALAVDGFWILKDGNNQRVMDIAVKTFVVNEAARI
jgi:uncharacterized RDD family membrane protein YckC